MKKAILRFFSLVIALMMLCSLMIPVNAAEARGTKYCPYCWDVLVLTDTYRDYTSRWIVCAITEQTGSVHEHLYWYTYEDWTCLGCGYVATLSTFWKEECRIGNYSLRPR
ncbi:MAG: hypothetical protein U0L59_04850 [Faecalimonas sp.]|nr:hypothetical protein [Faecalimonas sp.]